MPRLTASEPADRVWFRLWDKTCAPANLHSAFDKVWRNGGSAGAEEQTVAHFGRHAEAGLQRLHEQWRAGTYPPQPVRRAGLAKPGSKEKRPLGIPAVRDRMVPGALRHVLEPIFEADMAEHSYGFRPGRGAKDALRRVDYLLKAGPGWIVAADLKSCFDTIPHERLLALVKARVAAGRVLALGEGFLRAGVLETAKSWQPAERGPPPGGGISPLRANLDRNPLAHPKATAGWARGRYADDFVILGRRAAAAQAAVAAVPPWVSGAGLTWPPEKTRLVNAAPPGGFDFLGCHFERGRNWPARKASGSCKTGCGRRPRVWRGGVCTPSWRTGIGVCAGGMEVSSTARRTRLRRWPDRGDGGCEVGCQGDWRVWARGSAPPSNAGRRQGLPTVGCGPWQRNPRGRGPS